MKKCEFCGEYYDDDYAGTLDNGSPACPNCVEKEEAHEEERRAEKDNDQEEIREK